MSQQVKTKVVTPSCGPLKGIWYKNSWQFRGVPYAEQPVGDLRFAPTKKKAPWTEVLDATQHLPVPPQNPSPIGDTVTGDFDRPRGEGCLSLTITVPETDRKNMPVLVWIHGGANVVNAGSLEWYDGDELAVKGQMVTVNISSRLGTLGYLYYPGVSTENLQLLDIACALEWIEENIAAFGGNPHNLSVMGHSAGGNVIAFLLANPETRKNLRRAILLSPAIGRNEPIYRSDEIQIAKGIFEVLGIKSDDPAEIRRQILKKSPEELVNALDTYLPNATDQQKGSIGMILKPLYPDGWDTPKLLKEAALGCKEKGIHVMAGHTSFEFGAFFPMDQLKDFEKDELIEWPVFDFAGAVQEEGGDAWVYEFNWRPKVSDPAHCQSRGACHCTDLPFIFGTFEEHKAAPFMADTTLEEFMPLHRYEQDCFIRFINEGIPSDEADWPKYTSEHRIVKKFDGKENPCFIKKLF